MAAVETTLLALCALLAGVSADHDQCTTVTRGEVTDWAVPQGHVNLTPYILNWDIYFSSDQVCDLPDGYAVGLKVKACDPDGPPPPSVVLPSLQHAFVTRLTAARSTGIVHATVYCAPNRASADKQPRGVAQAAVTREGGERTAGRLLARARYAVPYD